MNGPFTAAADTAVACVWPSLCLALILSSTRRNGYCLPCAGHGAAGGWWQELLRWCGRSACGVSI